MTSSAVIVTCPGCGNDSCGSWVDCLDKLEKPRRLKLTNPSWKTDAGDSADRTDDVESRGDRTVGAKMKETVRLVRQLEVLLSPNKNKSDKEVTVEEKSKLDPESASESCDSNNFKKYKLLEEGCGNSTKVYVEPHGESENEIKSSPDTSHFLKEARQYRTIRPKSSKNRFGGISAWKEDETIEKDAVEILEEDTENIAPSEITSGTSFWKYHYFPEDSEDSSTRTNSVFSRKVDEYLDGSKTGPETSFLHYRHPPNAEQRRVPCKDTSRNLYDVESSSCSLNDDRNFEDVVDALRICVECGKEEVLCCFQEDAGPSTEPTSSVLMRLQLVVVETGQQWKKALIRMVLDPGKVDYGTLSVAVPSAAGAMNSQEHMYQRQPLLPNQGSLVLTIDDSDEDADGLQNMQALQTRHANGRMVSIKLPPPLKEEPRFPKEIFKTFIAFVIMAVGMIMGTATLSIVHERVPNLDVAERNVSKPLPDIFLDNVPTNDTWALNASEIIIMISVNSCILVIFFHKYRFIVARRVFLLMGLLYLLRCITMYITVLPVASYTYKCTPRAANPDILMYLKRTWQLLTGFGLSINGKHTYCGDFIYSGHTLILVMAYLIISEYSPRKLFPLHWLSWGLSMFGIICVLLSRGHYSIDVVIAYYVTTRVFWIYHTLACNVKLKEWGPNNYLSRVWWFPVFRYFEGNILAPVPRQYDWPLPWPRRFLSKRANRDS